MQVTTSAKWLLAIAAAGSLMACSSTRIQEGYVFDDELVAAIQPGVDNKQSVEMMLGQPSFTSQFSGDQWYYLSRELRQIAFRTPRPAEQQMLRVSFDRAGNVSAIDRQTGLDQVARIDPEGDTTATIDGESGFFDDLFDGVGGTGSQRTTGSGDPTLPD